MDDLIFIAQRIPYPPNKGCKIRSWNALVRLADHYRVHLGSFIDDPVDWDHEPVIRDLCESHCLLPLGKLRGRIRALRGFWTGEALTIPYFLDSRLARWLRDVRQRHAPKRAYTFSSGVAGYVMGDEWKGTRRVHDMVDIDSDKWIQYASGKSGLPRWIYNREGRKLLEFERRVAAEYDATLFVSEYEADFFRRLCPETAEKTHAMRNGVDCEMFDPARGYDDPYPSATEAVVLTGTMDYWPNVEAALWFMEHVLDALLERHPSSHFYVVGANPTRELKQAGERRGMTVTGRVDDVRPYIAHARVVVAPLRIARGIQNKVLEGMAMARPVVASPLALEGIQAQAGRDLLVADEPAEFLDTVSYVLREGAEQIGACGRDLVLREYSWDANFGKLIDFFEG